MANGYTMDDLLDFLAHASDKGLMPASTATALGVASRNVLGVLDPSEREDLRNLEIDPVIQRFNNKRAKPKKLGIVNDCWPSTFIRTQGKHRSSMKTVDLFLRPADSYQIWTSTPTMPMACSGWIMCGSGA